MVVKKTTAEVGTSAGSCRKLLPLYLYTALWHMHCMQTQIFKVLIFLVKNYLPRVGWWWGLWPLVASPCDVWELHENNHALATAETTLPFSTCKTVSRQKCFFPMPGAPYMRMHFGWDPSGSWVMWPISVACLHVPMDCGSYKLICLWFCDELLFN